MKTPRSADFDPTVTPPALKSSLDNMPAIVKPTKSSDPEAAKKQLHSGLAVSPGDMRSGYPTLSGPVPQGGPGTDQTAETGVTRSAVRPSARTPVRPNGKRIITRNSFEIYEDQMDALRKVSLEEKMDGKLGSMSAMVRDAIAFYLDRNSTKD